LRKLFPKNTVGYIITVLFDKGIIKEAVRLENSENVVNNDGLEKIEKIISTKCIEAIAKFCNCFYIIVINQGEMLA
jgi:hypothetical protein